MATNPDTNTETEGKAINWAQASNPADRQRREQGDIEKEPPLDIHIECSVSASP